MVAFEDMALNFKWPNLGGLIYRPKVGSCRSVLFIIYTLGARVLGGADSDKTTVDHPKYQKLKDLSVVGNPRSTEYKTKESTDKLIRKVWHTVLRNNKDIAFILHFQNNIKPHST